MYTQRRVYDQMMRAQQSVTSAIQSIAQAIDQENVGESRLNEARANLQSVTVLLPRRD
ncbi:hypothetical protein FTV88_2752 [Heliorestis convoluta]|uniref:Uncharacterized protein n=1 Tax=Heliorestis convoluta TaxID=356322 RepID=A0A5Q2N3F7_9FIRM|nr:hypothetical protein FTV88_2752 [Heliorestis convoluta]